MELNKQEESKDTDEYNVLYTICYCWNCPWTTHSNVKLSKFILNGSDDGVQHTELLGFLTFSIVWYSREHDVPETGSVSVLG
jgi:hypothetical protein